MAVTYKKVLLSGAEFIEGGGSSTPYAQTLATGDWVGPSLGEYTLTITALNHNKGASPTVQIYEANGLVYEQITTFVELNNNGDVTIRVSETPDLRFEGKIIID